MYRLVLGGLLFLAAVSVIASALSWLPFRPFQLIFSLAILLIACWLSNKVFALFTKAATTPESAFITGLIMFFIFGPLESVHGGLVLAVYGCVAMLSKYVLALHRKHIFNPAAVAAFIASVSGTALVSWWVATPVLFPFVLVIGLLFVRKVRKLELFLTFAAVATAVFTLLLVHSGASLSTGLRQFLLSWPLIFFGTVMITEPQTSPATGSDRLIYGAIIGLLFSLSFKIGPVSTSPEFALLVANIYAYFVSFRHRITLTLKEVVPLTREISEFVFLPSRAFSYTAGQYAEWTLPHRAPDGRGVRRFFTIVSAPEDPFVRLAMRLPVESSSFKRKLRSLTPGAHLSMTGIAGTFTLPNDPNEKIAAIAGGIGLTPFMSMFRHLAERHEHRDITLIYSVTSPLDFAYQQELDSLAPAIGLTVIYLPSDYAELTGWEGLYGYVTPELVRKQIKDYDKRTWYLSGPDAMVRNYKGMIHSLGVPYARIKTDYFQGL